MGAALVLTAALGSIGAGSSEAQQVDNAPPPFTASAAAFGVRTTLNIPGFALTDVPLDSGGPTAQTSLDSFGQSRGYAAMPDPGQFVVSLPGLGAGVLSGGGSLPPISLPFEAPAYPLSVTTQYPSVTDSSVGEGPYKIEAHSTATSSTARAIGGLQISAAGNTALLTSDTSLLVDNGEVTSAASCDFQGLIIGPLAIGQVRAKAKVIMAADGTLKPSSALTVDAMRVGGVGVAIGPDGGLSVLGLPVPLPVGSSITQLLDASGISLEVLPSPDTAEGTVISGALRVTVRGLSIPNVGKGTLTLTIGAASASLRSPAPTEPDATGAITVPPVAGDGTGIGQGTAGFAVPNLDGAQPPTLAGAPGAGQPAYRTIAAQPAFDLGLPYLVMAVAGFVIVMLGQLTRLLGVRAPWTTSDAG